MNAKPDAAETGGSLILWFDIIREARRGRTTLVRVLYIVTLFLILLIPYYATSRVDRWNPVDDALNYRARLATNFTVTILITQWLAALVLMPMYAVTSLHADRDNGTLELLLTTPVNGPQIINAKMWACFINVGGVLLGGVPLMAIIQIWGGVDLLLVVQNVVTTSAAMLAVCALSFHVALRTNRAMLAAGQIYSIWALWHFVFGFLPFVVIAISGVFQPGSPAEHLNFIGILGSFYITAWIFFQIRNGLYLTRIRTDMPTFHKPEPAEVPDKGSLKPEIGDNPLIWKERLKRDLIAPVLPAIYVAALAFAAIRCIAVFSATIVRGNRELAEFEHESFMLLLVVVIIGVAMVAAYLSSRLAGCIVRERELQTLDALLTLPWTRDDILFSKVAGILISESSRLVMLGVAWALLWVMAPFQPIGSAAFALAVIVQLFFFAALGLYLSVVCQSTVQAFVTQIVISLTLLVVPIAIPFIADIEPGLWLAFHPLTSLFILGQCWWWNDLARMAEFVWPQAIYFAAGVVLTISAWRRFRTC